MKITVLLTMAAMAFSVSAQACIPWMTEDITYNILSFGQRELDVEIGGFNRVSAFVRVSVNSNEDVVMTSDIAEKVSEVVAADGQSKAVTIQLIKSGTTDLFVVNPRGGKSRFSQKINVKALPIPARRGC